MTDLEQNDTIEIELNEKGAVVGLKGRCRAKDFKKQVEHLKELFVT